MEKDCVTCSIERPRVFQWDQFIIAVLGVAVAYVVLTKTGILSYAPADATGKGLFAVFGVGLVAAFSSCTAVISGLILGMSSRQAVQHPNASFGKRMQPHTLFNVGRLVGFAGFGAMVGALGSVFELSSLANGILVLAIAVLMIGVGIDLLRIFPAGFGLRVPKKFSQAIHRLSERNDMIAPMMLGALTFFLPCGFTQSMQLYALSTGSTVQAAMIMAAFALGTTPALLGFGAMASALRGLVLKRFTFAIGAVVVALGMANISNGATLLGFSGFVYSVAEITPSIALIDGKQVVPMEVSAMGYAPDVIFVKKGIPVDWEIYGGQKLGCGSTLVVPAFGLREPIYPGENQIAFTPTQTGSFPFTCSMGMLKGTLVVTN
jgi:sulfite exporter TauE/SafE